MMQEIILRGFSDDPDAEERLWEFTPAQEVHIKAAIEDHVMTGCRVEFTSGHKVREKRATIENSLAEIAKVLQGGLLVRLDEDPLSPNNVLKRMGQ